MGSTLIKIQTLTTFSVPKELKEANISFALTKLTETDISIPQVIVPYRYTLSAQKYYSTYFESGGENQNNFIISIFQGNNLIGLTPVSISKETRTLSSNGEAVLFPYIFEEISNLLQETIHNQFVNLILDISVRFNLLPPIFQEYAFEITPSIHKRLLTLGSRVLNREVYIKNCVGSHDEIWKDIRKSYKPYINKGLRELAHGVATGSDASSLFDSFRELHLEVSGRVTRSDLTWQIQKSEVLKNCAFLAYVKIGEQMVGCSFIPHSRHSALYAVGAYRRDLKNLNLGHISQWLAIEELNRIGVPTYRIGSLEISEGNLNSPRDISIAQFKKGFATETKYERLYYL